MGKILASSEQDYQAIRDAISRDDVEFIRSKLDGGLNVNDSANDPTANSDTLIAYAASLDAFGVMKLLHARGADVSQVEHELSNLAYRERGDIIQWCFEKGVKGGVGNKSADALAAATLKDNAEVAEILLKAGYHPHFPDHSPPLVFAVEQNSIELFALFMQYGGDPHFKTQHGGGADSTLLHAAVQHDADKIIPMLIEHGLDASLKDGMGDDVFTVAAGISEPSTMDLLFSLTPHHQPNYEALISEARTNENLAMASHLESLLLSTGLPAANSRAVATRKVRI